MTGLRPVGDKVLVEVLPDKKVTAGGLHVPEMSRNHNWWRCKVVAVGDGYVTDTGAQVPLQVKPGDVVLTKWRAGTSLDERPGGIHRVVREAEIVGVFGG